MRPSQDVHLEEQFQTQANVISFMISNHQSLFRPFAQLRRNSKSNLELARLLSRDLSGLDDITKGQVRVVVDFVPGEPLVLFVSPEEQADSLLERSLQKVGIQGDIKKYSLLIKVEGLEGKLLAGNELPYQLKQQTLQAGKADPVFLLRRVSPTTPNPPSPGLSSMKEDTFPQERRPRSLTFDAVPNSGKP